MGSYPWFLRAVGWDYVDGVGLAYFSALAALLVVATRRRYWRLSLFLAGITLAALLTINPYWMGFAPGTVVLFLAANHQGRRRNLILSGCIFVAGALAATLVEALFYRQVAGTFFFLRNSLNNSRAIVGSDGLTDLLYQFYGTMEPYWHIIPLLTMTGAAILLAKDRLKHERGAYLVKLAIIFQLIWSAIYLIFSHVYIQPYLRVFLYSSYIIPFTFLALGALLAAPLEALTTTQFRWLLAACFALLAATLLLSTLWYSLTRIQDNLVVLTVSGLLLLGSLLSRHRWSVVTACLGITLLSFAGGGDSNVYIKDRHLGRNNFKAVVDGVEAIDAVFPEYNWDFKVIREPGNLNIPGMAVAGIYYDIMGRVLMYQENADVPFGIVHTPEDTDIVLIAEHAETFDRFRRSEERRVGKECRSRWSPYH
jgi:hypothetical protein